MHVELRAERGAGQREDRPAGGIGDLGVLVGEGLPVGAHDHDVPGGGEVGLQVVDRAAGGGVGEGEVQVAAPAGLGVAVQLDADAVHDDAARALGQGHRSGRGSGHGDHLPAVHVGHLPCRRNSVLMM